MRKVINHKNKHMFTYIKSLVTFDRFAKVFTVLGLLAVIAYGVHWSGNQVVIMPASEFDAHYGSMEAKADTLHALKAGSR